MVEQGMNEQRTGGSRPPEGTTLFSDPRAVRRAIMAIQQPLALIREAGIYRLADPAATPFSTGPETPAGTIFVPPCRMTDLGDPSFCTDHRLTYPYVAGSMANGLTSAEMVTAMARAGMLGFFGAAGLTVAAVEEALVRIEGTVGDRPWGINLIHSPNEPELENTLVDLYLRRGVRLVEASAYLDLTPALIRYRLHGLSQTPDGRIIAPNRVVAKVSRGEVAAKFFSPPPDRLLRVLLDRDEITSRQAELAIRLPVAQDLTAEADSGGHTDNRPALGLIPTMMALRDRHQDRFGPDMPLRVGAAGGVATPAAAAAAWAMSAAYVLTGSINQSALEAGTCPAVREMLAKTGPADVTMAPAADMFELGVKVQVLKWGTMFPMRAAKLHELYSRYDRIEDLPPAERAALEKNFFRASLDAVWAQTRAYFLERDRRQVERAEQDPKHRMALVFRWYLGQTSHWANAGVADRRIDYQIFCGPAMGAFNEWVKGSFLEGPQNRDVVTMALNILYGSAVLTRMNILRLQGLALPGSWTRLIPLTSEEIKERLS